MKQIKYLFISLLIAFFSIHSMDNSASMEKINQSSIWNLDEVLSSNEKFIECLDTKKRDDPTIVDFVNTNAKALARQLMVFRDDETVMKSFHGNWQMPCVLYETDKIAQSLLRRVRKNKFFIDESSTQNNIHRLIYWLTECLPHKQHVKLDSALLQRLQYCNENSIDKFLNAECGSQAAKIPFAFLHAIQKLNDDLSLKILHTAADFVTRKYGFSYELIENKSMQKIFKNSCKAIKEDEKKKFIVPLFVKPLLTVVERVNKTLYAELLPITEDLLKNEKNGENNE